MVVVLFNEGISDLIRATQTMPSPKKKKENTVEISFFFFHKNLWIFFICLITKKSHQRFNFFFLFQLSGSFSVKFTERKEFEKKQKTLIEST